MIQEFIKRISRTIGWIRPTERGQVASGLTLITKAPFVPPQQNPLPTVDMRTRISLEEIRRLSISAHECYMSESSRELILSTFQQLIKTEVTNTTFPMSKLDGFTNSKCTAGKYPERLQQIDMASLGGLINDLEDLDSVEDDAIIERCKQWGEFRLSAGIRIYTDNWHKRFYWSNSGGSHHMAVLCHQLRIQNKEWSPNVIIEKTILNRACLDILDERISIYVVMADNLRFIFSDSPDSFQYGRIRDKLGVTQLGLTEPWMPLNYELIIIDHEREYSDLANNHLQRLIKSNQSMTLDVFLYECCKCHRK